MEGTPFSWKAYHEKSQERPPSESLVRAIQFVKRRAAALDLGAGSLRDSKYLVDQSFAEVVAVDKEPYTTALSANEKDKIIIVPASFETYDFPLEHFDLVNAQYSLPFTSPVNFSVVYDSLTSSLTKDGILVGQFFGKKDSWSERPNMTFHTEDEVQEMLSKFKTLSYEVIDKEGETLSGEHKHWHVFNVIAQKL